MELVEYIVKSLVDEPEEVRVSTVERGRFVVHQVEVADADLGKVIGRQGRVASALRTLVGALLNDDDARHTVEIMS